MCLKKINVLICNFPNVNKTFFIYGYSVILYWGTNIKSVNELLCVIPNKVHRFKFTHRSYTRLHQKGNMAQGRSRVSIACAPNSNAWFFLTFLIRSNGRASEEFGTGLMWIFWGESCFHTSCLTDGHAGLELYQGK